MSVISPASDLGYVSSVHPVGIMSGMGSTQTNGFSSSDAMGYALNKPK